MYVYIMLVSDKGKTAYKLQGKIDWNWKKLETKKWERDNEGGMDPTHFVPRLPFYKFIGFLIGLF